MDETDSPGIPQQPENQNGGLANQRFDAPTPNLPPKTPEDNKPDKELIGQEFDKSPRTVNFGVVTIEEDLNLHLVSEEERGIYQEGFDELKRLIEAADDVGKLYLTHPRFASVIIGFQGDYSTDKGDAAEIYRLYKKAGIDFNERHRIFEYYFEFERDQKIRYGIFNLDTAKNVLRGYQEQLGLIMPENPTDQAVENVIIALLEQPPSERETLAQGLLSGYPMGDIIPFARQAALPPGRAPAEMKKEWRKIDPESAFEDMSLGDVYLDFMKRDEDYKWVASRDVSPSAVQAFGLSWRVQDPVSEATKAHLQKFLEIDRDLGLLDYIRGVRRTFNRDEVLRTIEIAKNLKSG